MKRIYPYVRFNGNCKEAMTFYKDCFGGELTLTIVGDSPMASEMPPEMHDKIMHANLTNGNLVLMGSDLSPNDKPVTDGTRYTLTVNCDRDEANALFDNLSAGGKVSQELKEEFFGLFGAFEDKFGVSWMIQSD